MDTEKLVNPQLVSEYIWPLLVTYVPKILAFFFALLAAKMLSNWTGKLVRKALSKADNALQKFLSSLAKYTVLTVGVVTALGYLGVETAGFAAIVAASGLAIGLAFQGTLSNFAAGVMLLIFRPFKVGDYVEVSGEGGFIEEIELFTTEIKTPDNKRVIIPNSGVFGANITNFTHHPIRRIGIPVGTDYGADLQKTREVLERVPGRIDNVLTDPAPQIFLAGLGASSIDWQVRVWAKTPDYWDVYQRTVLETKKALDEAGIGIPFPQTDIHLDTDLVDALSGKTAAQTK